jgi:hypothetical protein
VPIVPTISDIVAKPFIDRIWMFVVTFFTMAVFQCEIRANYFKLHNIASTFNNNGTFFLGILSVFSLPCLAYFDTHTYTTMHSIFCVLFFGGCGFYLYLVGGLLHSYKSFFPEDDWAAIDRLNAFRKFMLGSVVVYYLISWFGPDTNSSFYEWMLVFMFMVAVCLLSYTNKMMETVRDP